MDHVKDILAGKDRMIVTIEATAPVLQAVIKLSENDIGAVIVADDAGNLTGILSERDVTRAVADIGPELMYENVERVMSANVITCAPSETVVAALTRMNQHNIRHLPVIDEDAIVGMVSIRDLMAAVLKLFNQENSRLRKLAPSAA